MLYKTGSLIHSFIRISLFAAAASEVAAAAVVLVTLEEPGKLDSVPNHSKNQSTGIQRTAVSFIKDQDHTA
jgi:hypothetical protein